MIALLVPSRGRPKELQRMIQSAYDTTNSKIHIYVAVSPEEFDVYKESLNLPADNNDRCGVVVVTMPDNLPTCQKWNKLAELAMNQPERLFMLGADDMIFTSPLWDEALISKLNRKPHVYHLQDSRDYDGSPHPIFTREWLEFWGYMVNPIWLHWFVDTWAVEVAKANNCFTHMREFELQHKKPSDVGQGDSTHNRIREWGWNNRDKYVWEKSQAYLEFDKNRLKEALK